MISQKWQNHLLGLLIVGRLGYAKEERERVTVVP